MNIHKIRFPRLFAYSISGNLSNNLGKRENISALARFDSAIINIYPPEDILYNGKTWQQVVLEIQHLNPGILFGAYTLLEETKDDPEPSTNTDIDKYQKIEAENWWLRDDQGQKINSYGQSYVINGSEYADPDSNLQRYPEWLAQRDFDKFFDPALTSGNGFMIWFLDNVREKPAHDADWNEDGTMDSRLGELAKNAYQSMYVRYSESMRALTNEKLLMGNVPIDDLSAYPDLLDASLNEALIGESWSPGGYPPWGEGHDGNWLAMMNRYNAHFNGVRARLVVFNVRGDPTDYQLFRFSFCSCLLNDGFFSFTDKAAGYVIPPWFDEYDFNLGATISRPAKTAWQNDVWRRDFENGIAFVNPTFIEQTVSIQEYCRYLEGSQDPVVNSGERVTGQVTIPARDGRIFRRMK